MIGSSNFASGRFVRFQSELRRIMFFFLIVTLIMLMESCLYWHSYRIFLYLLSVLQTKASGFIHALLRPPPVKNEHLEKSHLESGVKRL